MSAATIKAAAVASAAVETTGMTTMTRAAVVTGTAMMRGIIMMMMMVVRMIAVTGCITRSGAAAVVGYVEIGKVTGVAGSFAFAQRKGHEEDEEQAHREGGNNQNKYRCCIHKLGRLSRQRWCRNPLASNGNRLNQRPNLTE
jgi:hypothetical protein